MVGVYKKMKNSNWNWPVSSPKWSAWRASTKSPRQPGSQTGLYIIYEQMFSHFNIETT